MLRALARVAPRSSAGDGNAPADPPRTFSFVCSTDAEDSNGRIVVQDWDLARFLANPIVLWNHGDGGGGFWGDSVTVDEYFPIGKASNVRVEGGKLLADITIASEKANPLAERVFHALNEGVLNAVSVGWHPRDVRYEVHDDQEVVVMSGNELVEISVVPLPANPEAVRASFATRARELAHKDKPMNVTMLIALALGLTENATEDQAASRARELADLERTVRELTGGTTPAEARAALVALVEKAKAFDSSQAELAAERERARAARVAKLLEEGRASLKLTPANEAGLLRAFCGDETGAKADPAALDLFLKHLPAAANAAHAATPREAAEPSARPTEREVRRAAQLGVTPEALAAERLKIQRERQGLATDPDTETEA